MTEDLGSVSLLQRGWEVPNEVGLEVWIVGKLGTHHFGHVDALRVRQDDGELGRGETDSGRLALSDLLVGRQGLECAVEPPLAFEHVQIARMDIDHGQRLSASNRQGQRL